MAKGRIHYGWIVIFMGLLTAIAAHGFGRMAYTIILPAMKDGLSFDYTQLGLLGTGNFIGYLTMAIIGGFLAARFGTRIVITLALVLMGITMILTGLANDFGFAFAMRLLTGLGNGAAYVPAMALGSAWFSIKRRGFATGIVSAGIGAGTLISGLVVPPDPGCLWPQRLAVFLVSSGRRRSGDCRCGVFVCPQPSGRKRAAARWAPENCRRPPPRRQMKKRLRLPSGPPLSRWDLCGTWGLCIFSTGFHTLFTWSFLPPTW